MQLLSILSVVLALCVVALNVFAIIQRRKLFELEREIVDLHADIAALQQLIKTPRVVGQAEAIAHWRAEMAKYPEGSPKHTAFRNRLHKLGAE